MRVTAVLLAATQTAWAAPLHSTTLRAERAGAEEIARELQGRRHQEQPADYPTAFFNWLNQCRESILVSPQDGTPRVQFIQRLRQTNPGYDQDTLPNTIWDTPFDKFSSDPALSAFQEWIRHIASGQNSVSITLLERLRKGLREVGFSRGSEKFDLWFIFQADWTDRQVWQARMPRTSAASGMEEIEFGTDGVRWEINGTEYERGRRVGYALAYLALESGKQWIGIGRDGRPSSNEVQRGLMDAAREQGVHVVDYGNIPTPWLQMFVAADERMGGGAEITASHNPEKDIGIKLVRSTGEKTENSWEKEIANPLLAAEDPKSKAIELAQDKGIILPRTHGTIEDGSSVFEDAIAQLAEVLQVVVNEYGAPQHMMVVDAANSPAAGRVWRALQDHPRTPASFKAKFLLINSGKPGTHINKDCGAEFVEKGKTPDGKPNPLPLGVEVANGQVKVTDDDGVVHSFKFEDVFIAINDGDADRSMVLIFVNTPNQHGQYHRLVDGDRQIILGALAMKKLLTESKLTIPVSVAQTVMADPLAQEYLLREGIPFEMSAVGDKNVHDLALSMTKQSEGICDYGELSGHRGKEIHGDARRQIVEHGNPSLRALLQLENHFGDAIRNLLAVRVYKAVLEKTPTDLATWPYQGSSHHQEKVKLPPGVFSNDGEFGLVLGLQEGRLVKVGNLKPDALDAAAAALLERKRSGILKVAIRKSGTESGPTEDSVRIAVWANPEVDAKAVALDLASTVSSTTGLEELAAHVSYRQFCEKMEQAARNWPAALLFAKDGDGVTAPRNKDMPSETRIEVTKYLVDTPTNVRIMDLTDIGQERYNRRILGYFGDNPSVAAKIISRPLSGAMATGFSIPSQAIALINQWIQQQAQWMRSKGEQGDWMELVLRPEEIYARHRGGYISTESRNLGYEITRDGDIVRGINIGFNLDYLARRWKRNSEPDTATKLFRDRAVRSLKSYLLRNGIPNSILKKARGSGRGSFTWVPIKGETLRWDVQRLGINPRAVVFVDDEATNFLEFPDVARWPGLLIYIGEYSKELTQKAPNVVQVARPGQGKPSNGPEIARWVIRLDLAKHLLPIEQTMDGPDPLVQRWMDQAGLSVAAPVGAGMEEQLSQLASTWFGGDKELARERLMANAAALMPNGNGRSDRYYANGRDQTPETIADQILDPLLNHSDQFWTPDQIDAYHKAHPPKAVAIGGGGTATLLMRVMRLLLGEEDNFAVIVAVDDSDGNAGLMRPWTVVAVGDLRNALVNRLEDELMREFISTRLRVDQWGANLPKTIEVEGGRLKHPPPFQAAFRALLHGRQFKELLEGELHAGSLWTIQYLDTLMGIVDRAIQDNPQRYEGFPVQGDVIGNLMIYGAQLAANAIQEPVAVESPRYLDPQRMKVAIWLLERVFRITRGHVVMASSNLNEQYGIFANPLVHSRIRADGHALVGRIRPWYSDEHPSAEDRKNRIVFSVHQEESGRRTLIPQSERSSPIYWGLPSWDEIPSLDQELLRQAAPGDHFVFQGYAMPASGIYTIRLQKEQLVAENLLGENWTHGFPPAEEKRLKDRLREKGPDHTLTLLLREGYEESDTWHGNDIPRHLHFVNSQEECGNYILESGSIPSVTPDLDGSEALETIQNILRDGEIFIGPGSVRTSIWAVLRKPGMWQAIRDAVSGKHARGVFIMNNTYDTGTWGYTYEEELQAMERELQRATGDDQAKLNSAITHLIINMVPKLDRDWLATHIHPITEAIQAIESKHGIYQHPVVSDQLNELEETVRTGNLQPWNGARSAQLSARLIELSRAKLELSAEDAQDAGVSDPALEAFNKDPDRDVWVSKLQELVSEPAITMRAYALSVREGGKADSPKLRGLRRPKDGEISKIYGHWPGIHIIYEPVAEETERLRADSGVTRLERNTRTSAEVLARICASRVLSGLEEFKVPSLAEQGKAVILAPGALKLLEILGMVRPLDGILPIAAVVTNDREFEYAQAQLADLGYGSQAAESIVRVEDTPEAVEAAIGQIESRHQALGFSAPQIFYTLDALRELGEFLGIPASRFEEFTDRSRTLLEQYYQ